MRAQLVQQVSVTVVSTSGIAGHTTYRVAVNFGESAQDVCASPWLLLRLYGSGHLPSAWMCSQTPFMENKMTR